MSPAVVSALLSLLTLIPNFIPKEDDFINILLKLKKLTIAKRGHILNRFTLRQFEEKAADSIMEVDESSINSEELFTRIDCYTDHRKILIKTEKSYYTNIWWIRVSLVISIVILALSQINNPIVQTIVFIVGLIVAIISIISFFKLWRLNGKAHNMESHSDFI